MELRRGNNGAILWQERSRHEAGAVRSQTGRNLRPNFHWQHRTTSIQTARTCDAQRSHKWLNLEC
eukprot:558379-Pyramimonas_sp.AAC.1